MPLQEADVHASATTRRSHLCHGDPGSGAVLNRAVRAGHVRDQPPASKEGTDLERYATLDALGKVELDLARMKKAGTVVRGSIGHDAKVTALDSKATLSDCVDLSRYETYDARAHKTILL
ncbi:hypothetical protein [Streptomyces sp. NPDC050534]|uniref:hypothetical protein n=1 Tax=Streptomyces sp. NPDC050534 TaxID=3365625 RepID=UPI0037A95A2C